MPRVLLSGLLALLLASPSQAGDAAARWALQPLRRPSVPLLSGAEAARLRNPIDAFVLQKLRQKGLQPAPEADRRTLIRRLAFDLTGLPPTPEEIAAFLKDTRPDAYERLVDRLLGSPAYGERWARHWLDVVHFGETHGHDQDRVRPNAWPYRDYVIQALNEDRPYGRFVEEQVAADVLYPNLPQRIPALGFLAAGPWDESSLRDIREDSIDRKIGHYLDRDDMVTSVMSTFAGQTAHCARCHDHPFDPIAQADYYALQAVFAGVGRGERTYESDPLLARRRVELLATESLLARRDRDPPALLRDPALIPEIRAWEARLSRPSTWTVLAPERVTSTAGATLTRMPDGSIYSEGKRPERDTYVFTARVPPLKRISGVRLEVMTDNRLPHKGPGRQDNGNLHLSEIRLWAGATPVPIARATADFNQAGWTIAHAIDGQPRTAWGIYPRVGTGHVAVFELKDNVPIGKDARFRIELEQSHGGGHLIGRFRLSVTDARRPLEVGGLPDEIAAALRLPFEKRSQAQKDAVARHYLLQKLASERAKLPPAALVYAAGRDFKVDGSHRPIARPRPVHLLRRGDIHRPIREAKAGALACVEALSSRFELSRPDDEGQRRAALARWLSDPKNPLTWRVIVNRVWHHHFGRGIVDTPSDLGAMGGRPTHPELLDWLATEFRGEPGASATGEGGSLKALHRLIVTSATYRQSSAHHPANARRDADNRYLWRMNRSRLDAESLRDAILQASGRLDRRAGGPSDQQFSMKPGIHVTPVVDYLTHAWDRPAGHRRSIYRFVFRTLPDPFVDCFDGPDASQWTPVRNSSITPLQALALLNNPFVLAHSKAMAANLQTAFADPARQVEQACERIWGRPPTPGELAAMRGYAQRHGLANLCRLLFNASEFLFVN